MIPQETIQQIISRIDIIEIINTFVKLKRRGTNYLGLCPFHNEKSPSFTVSPSKEIYKCFGCGKSGNTITFLMEHEKYSYVEALKWLAAKYNIPIEETEVSPEMREQHQVADSLYIINKFAQQYFAEQLQTEEGKNIGYSYFKERGFRDNIIEKFGLGYSPEGRESFATAALDHQFNKEYLLKSGLAVERDNRLQDNYRGRVIFPVHNQSGKVCGFGARLVKKNDKAPKYINTPENEIYVKSKILYGSWFARQAIDKADECLLVEGYTDVVSLHQAGIENVVASGGTSLTPDQLRLIKKYTRNLTILYDGDPAGIKAALRGLNLALEEGLEVRLVLLPDAEDPDSLVQKYGAAKFTSFIQSNKKEFILFQLEYSLKEAGDDSTKRAQVVSRIAESISKINKAEDFTRQQDFIQKTAEILQIDEAGLHNLVNKFTREKISKEESRYFDQESKRQERSGDIIEPLDENQEALSLISKDTEHQKSVVRCLIEFGLNPWTEEESVAQHILTILMGDELIDDPLLSRIVERYKFWYDEGLEPTSKSFLYDEDLEMSNMVTSLIEFPYEVSEGWQSRYEMKVPTRDESYQRDIESSISYLQLKRVRKLILENEAALSVEEDPNEQMVLMQVHYELKKMEIKLIGDIGTVILK